MGAVLNVGSSELIVIIVVALVFLGPKVLPELASGLGKVIREIRKATADIKTEIELDETIRKPLEELREATMLPPEELKRRDLEKVLRAQEEKEERAREERESKEREVEAARAAAEIETAARAEQDRTMAATAPTLAAQGGIPAPPPPFGAASPAPSEKTVAMESPFKSEFPKTAPRGLPVPSPVSKPAGSVPRETLVGMPAPKTIATKAPGSTTAPGGAPPASPPVSRPTPAIGSPGSRPTPAIGSPAGASKLPPPPTANKPLPSPPVKKA
jgi:TatA/E family protein of Tat protein translocase